MSPRTVMLNAFRRFLRFSRARGAPETAAVLSIGRARVPLKKLTELAEYRRKRWEFKDGWLILEAF